MKEIIILLLLFIALKVQGQQNKTDSLNIYYAIGKSALTKKQIEKIEKFTKKLNSKTNYKVQIISSADFIGDNKSNKLLAQNRANEIKKLLKQNFNFKQFKITNKGEINSDKLQKDGVLKDRKSTIIFKPITDAIKFNKIKAGEKYILQNLNFKPGKAIMIKKSFAVLDKIVAFLKENPTVEILIAGHVCCDAGIYNPNSKKLIPLNEEHLSTKRAKFIYHYLIFKGIDQKRLKYTGYGFQTPLIYPEKNEKDMQKNKRVEIIITKK